MNLSQFTSIVVDGSDCLCGLDMASQMRESTMLKRWRSNSPMASVYAGTKGIKSEAEFCVLRAGVFDLPRQKGHRVATAGTPAWQLGCGCDAGSNLGGVLEICPGPECTARVEPGEFEFPSAEEVQLLMKEAGSCFRRKVAKTARSFRRAGAGSFPAKAPKQ